LNYDGNKTRGISTFCHSEDVHELHGVELKSFGRSKKLDEPEGPIPRWPLRRLQHPLLEFAKAKTARCGLSRPERLWGLLLGPFINLGITQSQSKRSLMLRKPLSCMSLMHTECYRAIPTKPSFLRLPSTRSTVRNRSPAPNKPPKYNKILSNPVQHRYTRSQM
jgi:hypothetical protein